MLLNVAVGESVYLYYSRSMCVQTETGVLISKKKNEFRVIAPIVSLEESKIKVYFCSQHSIRPLKMRGQESLSVRSS